MKAAALELGLPVTHDVDDVRAVGVDLGVVVAYGAILRADLLAEVPMVNIHFSLLPRWRGAAPVERALLAGDDRTGVCIMEVVEALDAGGVHARAEVPITATSTAAGLRDELARVGADLLVDTLRHGLGQPEPQVDEPTYAKKIRPDDLHLDWEQPVAVLDRVVRVGGAWTTLRGKRLRVTARRPRPHRPPPRPTGHRHRGRRARSGSPPVTGRWHWSRCSPRARPASPPPTGLVAPASPPTIGWGRERVSPDDDHERPSTRSTPSARAAPPGGSASASAPRPPRPGPRAPRPAPRARARSSARPA